MVTASQGVGLREIARELGVTEGAISYWVKKGWVTVLQPSEGRGQGMLLDRLSVEAVAARRLKKKSKVKRTRGRGRGDPRPNPTPPPSQPDRALARSGSGSPSPSRPRTEPPSSSSHGFSDPPVVWSTAELFREYLFESRRVTELDETTMDSKERRIRPFVEEVPFLPATRQHVTRHLAALPVSLNTKHTHFRQIKAFLHWAQRAHGVPYPNLDRVLKTAPRPQPYSLKVSDLPRIQQACRNRFDLLLVYTAFCSGMRATELANLRQAHLRMDAAKVEGKMGQALRFIPQALREMLIEWGFDPPFFDINGKPLTKDGVGTRLRRILKDAGVDLPHYGANVFRHSFATIGMLMSKDPELIRQLMGHTSIKTTQIYSAYQWEAVEERGEQLGLLNLFNGGGHDDQRPV